MNELIISGLFLRKCFDFFLRTYSLILELIFFKKLFSIDEFKISPYTNKEGFKAKLKCLTKGFSSFSINVGDRFCFQTTDFSVDYDLWLKARKMFKDLISVERRK